jgi:NOL1/NOP2/fmu family ribosome biogenesis protein
MEGTQLLKEQITRNIFEIENEKDLEIWMHGSELNIKTGMSGFIVIKYKNDFLGCGKASENKIGNFIPKSRRLKVRG